VVLAPYGKDRHPDHAACSLLVKHSLLYARLKKLGHPHHVSHIYYYMLNTPFDPIFVVDITESFHKKMEVLACYHSQFHADLQYLRDYIPHVAAKASYYGTLINAEYGEPFLVEGYLRIGDPVTL
jgi:LmbE family N-acetylglucosaminyl deacetylase